MGFKWLPYVRPRRSKAVLYTRRFCISHAGRLSPQLPMSPVIRWRRQSWQVTVASASFWWPYRSNVTQTAASRRVRVLWCLGNIAQSFVVVLATLKEKWMGAVEERLLFVGTVQLTAHPEKVRRLSRKKKNFFRYDGALCVCPLCLEAPHISQTWRHICLCLIRKPGW